jgi:hypothetical protein
MSGQPQSSALERLTEPTFDEAGADDGGGEMVEGLMDVGATLVADGEAAEAGEPGERALDNPTVAPQALGTVDAAPGDARHDPAVAAGPVAGGVVVGLVGVELGGPAPRPPAALSDRPHRIQHRREHAAVVPVGGAQAQAERDAVRVDQEMTLAARTAAIGWVRACLLAPLLAATAALSSAQRDQSMAFARPSRSSRTRCSWTQTPAICQSRSRRQQVMPDPQPISLGSISQGIPDFSTNRMPVSAARSRTGGRPPFGRGRHGGKRGASSAHSASGTSGLTMPDQPAHPYSVPGFDRRSKLDGELE